MPKITSDRIIFTPEDRYAIQEQSPDIDISSFVTLFNQTKDGTTMHYYKFLEEIVEKDPDIATAIGSRTSNITSKEWTIEGPNTSVAEAIKGDLEAIVGVPEEGLLSMEQLIASFLGDSYLIGISMNEIVTDEEKILGFNHIPAHFLTFYDTIYYPKLWTEKTPTGIEFNKDKMIAHYLNPGNDVARGWMGHSVGLQYVLKRTNLDNRLTFEGSYGKGFLLVNMPANKDSYEEAWSTAEDLVDNIAAVDGVVFPDGVEADFKEPSTLEGEFFFKSQEDFKNNIIRIILGQESTTSSESSNRSTADVHKDVLEQRILQDISLIENTLTKQLISKIKELKGISENDNYEFKFMVGGLEETLDDDLDESETNESISNKEGIEDGQRTE